MHFNRFFWNRRFSKWFILEIKIHEYSDNDEIDDLQKLGLKYVPGEVFEDDTILIEIEKEQSEKVKNQNPLHIIASMQNVQLLMLSVTKWFGMVDVGLYTPPF